MAYPTEIPSSIRAGNNLEFTQQAYDTYGTQVTSGAGYTLYMVLANETANYSVSSQTEVDSGYLVQVPFATTSGWTAGEYTYGIYADNGTNRYPQTTGFIKVLAELNTTVDGRSDARKIRDALDAAILGQASSNQLSMSIAGRSIQRMSLTELIDAKKTYDRLVAKEEADQDIADGKPVRNTIQVRFK